MTACTINAAAADLSVSRATLCRWIDQGAPVARRGSRGRGRATLVDPGAVRAWRRAQGGEDALLAFAARVPEILSHAAMKSFRLIEGPTKRPAAGVLAGAWYLSACAILDAMRAKCPEIPELSHIPESIERLREIAKQ